MDTGARDRDGNTLLHLATSADNPGVVERLVEICPGESLRYQLNNRRETPADIAQRMNCPEVLQALKVDHTPQSVLKEEQDQGKMKRFEGIPYFNEEEIQELRYDKMPMVALDLAPNAWHNETRPFSLFFFISQYFLHQHQP